MLIVSAFNSVESYQRVKDKYKEQTNIEFTNNINNIEDLRQILIQSIPDLLIVDSKLKCKNEIIELINNTNKSVRIITFLGNFEILNNRVNEEIKNYEYIYKANKETDNQDPNVKVVYIDSNSKIVENRERPKESEKEYIEVIKEVEVEKPVFIEKTKEVLKEIEVMSNSVITCVSASSNGKSYLSWNLAHALADRGYEVAVINLDNGYSANRYYYMDEDDNRAFKDIDSKDAEEIYKNFYQFKHNIKVYTGSLCSKEKIDKDKFLELLNLTRVNNDIVIIDGNSELDENLLTSLYYSNSVVFVFDLDNMHLYKNLNLLEKIYDKLNFKKTVAVINNVYKNSKELNHVRKTINDISEEFKAIIEISNIGDKTHDYIYTETCNYFKDNKFKNEFDDLVNALSAKRKKKGLISKFFN